MKNCIYILILMILLSCKTNEETNQEINEEIKDKKSVLVFSKTRGFRHASIPDGIKAIQKLGSEKGFLVQTTEDAAIFNKDSLQKYSAVIFLSTTGDVLNDDQQAVFEDYIQDGGGYVGIHSATDTESAWTWYRGLVGADFNQHPEIQQADLMVVDNTHTATKLLPQTWQRTDEWYNFKNISSNIHILIKIDESTYTGGTTGENHPMVWYHKYDGGRAFYTALGHTSESYTEDLFMKHLWGGIEYAMGEL
jgi:type 1 glutamine amidotransferase